jgi:hypothetical protein
MSWAGKESGLRETAPLSSSAEDLRSENCRQKHSKAVQVWYVTI